MKVLNVFWESGTTEIPQAPPGAIRIVCMSDTHSSVESKYFDGTFQKIPNGDIFLHAGDFSSTGTLKEVEEFEKFISKLPHKHKIVIAGNHDITFDENYYKIRGGMRFHRGRLQDLEVCRNVLISSPGVTYLQDSGATVEGITFWGSPWQPEFCDWGFNLPLGSAELRKKWGLIPENTDVVITHGPPRGHGGVTSSGFDAGCPDLLKRILEIKPALHVFGHIHEGYGVTNENGTCFVNPSTCTLAYRPTNPPIVVDVIPSDCKKENKEDDRKFSCLLM